MGRVVPEYGDPLTRELIVGDYRVVYDREDDDVWIVAVKHASQLLRLPDR